MKRLMLVERSVSGHRLYYVRLLAEAGLAEGYVVTLILPIGGSESDEARVHLGKVLNRISLLELPDLTFKNIESVSIEREATRTVIPDGDWSLVQLARAGWQGAGTLSLVVMRERAQGSTLLDRVRTLVKRWAMARARNAKGVAAVAVLRSATWMGESPFVVVRDPVTSTAKEADRQEISKQWDLVPDRYWFGVFGKITYRKNLALIAKSLADSELKTGLLIAGLCDPEELQRSSSHLDQFVANGGRLIVVDRLLTDVELDAAVELVDCIVLAHSNEGPSGLLGKAASHGTRILAAGAESLRIDSEALADLADWVPLTAESLSSGLVAASQKTRPEALQGLGAESFTSGLIR